MRRLTKREQWFHDRVWKIVWRGKTSCTCAICDDVYENGLLIRNADHAQYVSEVEAEYNHDGIKMKYFDTKEEAREFEKQ